MAKKNAMTPEVFREQMAVINQKYDIEQGHSEADKLMCAVLESLGYGDGIEIFRKMEKWYA